MFGSVARIAPASTQNLSTAGTLQTLTLGTVSFNVGSALDTSTASRITFSTAGWRRIVWGASFSVGSTGTTKSAGVALNGSTTNLISGDDTAGLTWTHPQLKGSVVTHFNAGDFIQLAAAYQGSTATHTIDTNYTFLAAVDLEVCDGVFSGAYILQPSSQNISAQNSWTPCNLTTVGWTVGSDLTTSTSKQISFLTAGYYAIDTIVNIGAGASNDTKDIAVRKNGSNSNLILRDGSGGSNAGFNCFHTGDIQQFAASDFIDVVAMHNGSSTAAQVEGLGSNGFSATTASTWLQVTRMA